MTSPAAARHILAFAQTLSGGGVERALLRLMRGWVADGRRVTLVLGDANGPLAVEMPPEVAIVSLDDAGYLSLLRGVPAQVAKHRPDVLFCPGNHYSAVAAWTRLALGRRCPPIVGKVSNALVRVDMGPVLARAYRWWLARHPAIFDELVAMTAASAREAVATMAFPAWRVHVIANPATQAIPGAAPVTLPSGRYLLGVGRLVVQKRWERAVSALARLSDPTIPLVLLGEGPERAAIEAHAAALGLTSRVSLPGHAADPLPAIRGAAAVVLTSDFEGVPGVLREAAAMGTPVVATDSSVAVREMVGLQAGSVVPIGDEDALVAALEHWLAPGQARPEPAPSGGDPAADYLALFDALVRRRPLPRHASHPVPARP